MQDFRSRIDSALSERGRNAAWQTLAGMSNDEINVFLVLREYWEAFRLQDKRRIEPVLDEEYADSGGLNKAQTVALTGASGCAVSNVQVDYANAVVHLVGDRAVIQYDATYVIERPGGSREQHFVESIDVLRKRNGVWRIYQGTHDEDKRSAWRVD